MNDEELAAITAEIERQDACVAEAAAHLGDAEVEVPCAFFEELDQLTTPNRSPQPIPIHSIRV